MIWWGRLLGRPYRRDQRVTCADWVFPLMEMARDEGWRVCYLGGRPGVAEVAIRRLTELYPGLHVAVHHGFFQRDTAAPANQAVPAWIGGQQPHVLLVGLGMPIQEQWLLENRDHLNVPVSIAVGACFDYVAGAKPMPRRWLGRVGLEWSYRLVTEPRRLWRRYLVEPFSLVDPMISDLRMVLADRLARHCDRAQT